MNSTGHTDMLAEILNEVCTLHTDVISDESVESLLQANESYKLWMDESGDHWIHEHTDEAASILLLAGLLQYLDSAKSELVKNTISQILSDVKSCPQCVVMYHSAKVAS